MNIWDELTKFLEGKKITGVVPSMGDELDGFDILFEDGSALELYVIKDSLAFVMNEKSIKH